MYRVQSFYLCINLFKRDHELVTLIHITLVSFQGWTIFQSTHMLLNTRHSCLFINIFDLKSLSDVHSCQFMSFFEDFSMEAHLGTTQHRSFGDSCQLRKLERVFQLINTQVINNISFKSSAIHQNYWGKNHFYILLMRYMIAVLVSQFSWIR